MKAFLLFSLAMGKNPAAHPNRPGWPAPSFPLAQPSQTATVAQLPYQVFLEPTRPDLPPRPLPTRYRVHLQTDLSPS
jgi:hypothetical protein